MKHQNKQINKHKIIRRVSIASFLILSITVLVFVIVNMSRNNNIKNPTFIKYTSYYNGEQAQIGSTTNTTSKLVVTMSDAYDNQATEYNDKLITISSAEELYKFSDACNGDNKTKFLSYKYKLLCNIDFDDYRNDYFKSIGITDEFTGVFDGDGWDISNLELERITSSNYANYTNIQYYAMFAKISDTATIKNFGLINPRITIAYQLTTLSTNGMIANVCGLNNGTISGVYVNQLSTSLVDECGITASGEYRVSGFVGDNKGTIDDCYLATNSVYNYTITDITDFSDIAIQNSGHITNTYYYDTSIQSCTQSEMNGSCNIKYVSDLGVSEKNNWTCYGLYVDTLSNLNGKFKDDSAWRIKSNDNKKIEYYYSNETPVRRNLSFTSVNQNSKLTSATASISNSRDFLMMFELMNSDATFASSIMTYNIVNDIDLSGITNKAYTYSHLIGANIKGASITNGTINLVSGNTSTYPTIYNADITSNNRATIESGLYAYGLFPYFVGNLSELNIYINEVNLNSINENNDAKAIGALCGYAEGATINNVNVYMNVTNTNSKLGEYYLGGIVGVIGGESSISNVTSAGSFNLSVDSSYVSTTSSAYLNGIAIGGVVGYIDESLANLDTLLSGVNINANLGSNKSYAIGGVVGAGYTRICQKLENVGNVNIGSSTTALTYSNLYLSGIIGRLLGESGETAKTAEINNLTNQGTVTLYGSSTSTKNYVSGILNADIQSNSQFINKAGQKLFYAASLTNRANVNIYNSGYSDKLYYTSGVNVLSNSSYVSHLESLYNLNNTYKYNDGNVRTKTKLNANVVDLSLISNYAGLVNKEYSSSFNNSMILNSIYNLSDIEFNTTSSIANDISVAGVVLGDNISFSDIRNEGNLSFNLSQGSSVEHNLYVSGLFNKLSLNNTANNLFNGGNISFMDSSSSDISINIFASGICHENLAEITSSEQNPLSSTFNSNYIGSLNNTINNGNIKVTSKNYNKEQTLYKTSSTNNPVKFEQSVSTYLKGSVYAAGISYSNSGIISNTFNLGDITLDLFAKTNCNFYAAGITIVQNGEYAQIRDCANNGTIQAINTSNSNTAKMIVAGIAALNNSNSSNIKQVLAFDINYGTIIGFNGTENVARSSVSNLNSYVSGILGYGISNIVNILNYGNIYGSESVGSIVASFKLSDFNNVTCNLANTINYGNLYELLKYKSNGSTWNYANYNTVVEKAYTSIGTYNGSTRDYYYLGAMFGFIDFNSQSNLNIRYVINLFKGAPIAQKDNQLNTPSSNIDTSTFITVDGVTNVFGGSSVGYAPLTTVEDSDGNIGVFSSKFVFRKAINGEGIDYDIVTDSYIEDYFQFVRFDKINDTLLEKIGWKTISYLDAAENLAKNVKALSIFVGNDNLTIESKDVNAAFTSSSWIDNVNSEVLLNLINASIGNTEFSDTLDQIIYYILFDNDCISDVSQTLRENIVSSIISYYDNENDTDYYTILQKLLYDELLAKIVSGETTNYQAVQKKINEILKTADNKDRILKNYLDAILADDTVLNPLFSDELNEYYITKKVDLITSLLDGYADDTLKTMVDDIIGDSSSAGSALKYQSYLKNNESTATELYSLIIASNTFNDNEVFLNVFNKAIKKYDISSYVTDSSATTNASNEKFTDKEGSTYINGTRYSYTKDYTELWNIVKKDSNFQKYLINNYFETHTDPTSGVNYNSLIAKATEYNSTYQSQNEPSTVDSSNGKNSTSGVMRSAGTINGNQRYIYTPDDLVHDSTYYYGPFDVTGNTLNVTAGFRKDFNVDIYNASNITTNENFYAPIYISLNESDRENYIKKSNTNSSTKSKGSFYWNNKQSTNNAWNQWVSDYITTGSHADNCQYILQKITSEGEYIKYGYDFSDSYNTSNDTIKEAKTVSAHNEIKSNYVVGYVTSSVYTGIWYPVSCWYSNGIIGMYLTAQNQTFDGSYKGVQTTQYTYYQINDLVSLDGVRTRGKSSGKEDGDEISIISALITDILSKTDGKQTVLNALASYANKNGLTKEQSASAHMLLSSLKQTSLKQTSFAASTITNEISLIGTTSLEKLTINKSVGTTTYTNVGMYLDSLVQKISYSSREQLVMAGATDKDIFKKILVATLTNFEEYDDDSSDVKTTSKDLTYYIYRYYEYLEKQDDSITLKDVINKLKNVSSSDLTVLEELSKLTFDSYTEFDSADGNIDEGSEADFGGSLDMQELFKRISYIYGTGDSAYIDQAKTTTWASTVEYNSDATKNSSRVKKGYAMPLIVSNDISSQEVYNTLAKDGYESLGSGTMATNSTYEVTALNNIGYYTGNGAKITAKNRDTNIKSTDLTGKNGVYTDFKIYTKKSNTSGSQYDIEVTDLQDDIKTALLNDINSNIIYNIRLQNQISTNNQVVLDQMVVAGKTYNSTSYLPDSAVWFTPQQDGYVKIALSSLNDGKKGFTLYQINRDSSDLSNPYGNKITSTTVINTVYMDNDGEIYYNPSDTTNKTLVFDKTWTAEFTANTLYYYEIPVKAGIEYALGNTDGDGAYLIYLDIGQNAGSNKISYPNLTNIENNYNIYYNTTSEYGSYLASNLVKVTQDTTLTIYEPTIILVKTKDEGIISVNGTTSYDVNGETVSVSSVKFKSEADKYKGFYLSGSTEGTTYTIGVSGTYEILVLEQDNSIKINTNTDQITFVDGSTAQTIYKGLTYENLKSFNLNIDMSSQIIDTLMLIYPTIRINNSAYDSKYEYTIFREKVFTNENLKEIVKLLTLADYNSEASSLGKLIKDLNNEYYDDLLKTISDEDVMKNMAKKFISMSKNDTSYEQEVKYIIAAYIGNNYLECSNNNSLTQSILYNLLGNYNNGDYQFINGDKSIDATTFDKFMREVIGQTSNIEGYGIFALASSDGIKNGTFIPDNIDLVNMDSFYNKCSKIGTDSIIDLTDKLNSSWRDNTGASTSTDFDTSDQSSVNHAFRVEMKQLKLAISTAIFELDLDDDNDSLDEIYATEETISESNGTITYYVPSSYLDYIKIKDKFNISFKNIAKTATFITNNNNQTTINLSEGSLVNGSWIVEDAVIVTAEDSTVVNNYKMIFVPVDISFDVSTSNTDDIPAVGGSVTLNISTTNIPDGFDFKPFFSIKNGETIFKSSSGTFSFDQTIVNNGVVSNNSATLVIDVDQTLPGGSEEFTLDFYDIKKIVNINKIKNTKADFTADFEGSTLKFIDNIVTSNIKFGRAYSYSDLTDINSNDFYLKDNYSISANATMSISASIVDLNGNSITDISNYNDRIQYKVEFKVTPEDGAAITYTHFLREMDYFSSNYANVYENGSTASLYTGEFTYNDDLLNGSSLSYSDEAFAAVKFRRSNESDTPEYRIKYNLDNFYTLGEYTENYSYDTPISETYHGITVSVSADVGIYKYTYKYSRSSNWNEIPYTREFTLPALYVIKGYSKESKLSRLTFLNQSIVLGNTVSVMKYNSEKSTSILLNNSATSVDGKEVLYSEIFASSARNIEIRDKTINYSNLAKSDSVTDYYAIGTVSNSELSYYAPTFGIDERAQIYQYTTKTKLKSYGEKQTSSDATILTNHDDMYLYVPFTYDKDGKTLTVVYLIQLDSNGNWYKVYTTDYNGEDESKLVYSYESAFSTLEASNKASFNKDGIIYSLSANSGMANDDNQSLYMDYIGNPALGHFWYVSYVVFSESYLNGENIDGNIRYFHISIVDATNVVYFDVTLWAPQSFTSTDVYMTISENIYSDTTLTSSRQTSGYLEKQEETKIVNGTTYYKYRLKFNLQTLPKGYFYFYVDLPDGYTVKVMTDMVNQLDTSTIPGNKEEGSFLPYTTIITKTINLVFVVDEGKDADASKWALSTSDIYTRKATYYGDSSKDGNSVWYPTDLSSN